VTTSIIQARKPHESAGGLRRTRAPIELEPFLSDAAHYPGGRCDEVCFPASEADVASILAQSRRVLAVGAQSSLTGGATPQGGTVLSMTRMKRVLRWTPRSVRVDAGLVLAALEPELRARGVYYPPVPTYDGATVGGTVATNAAGAATFKYGTTREWIDAITVVLASGDVLDVRRGEVTADVRGQFEIVATSGAKTTLDIPRYRMPAVRKHSAGYFAKPGMDLIDLFIGSEGTLGIVTEVELRVVPDRPAWLAAFTPVADDAAAVALVSDLRAESKRTWESGDRSGGDVAAVEYLDRRCLELLHEDGAFKRSAMPCPESAGAALIFQVELPPGTTRDEAFDELGRIDVRTADSPLLRVCRILVEHGVFEATVPVLPGEDARRDALFRLRESAPEGVNRRIRERQRDVDARITKAGGDVIVPFERFAESLAAYRKIMKSHGLDHAIWGHISDGNVHPNALPTDGGQAERARAALLEIGEAAIAMGGSPMSEHGVGRNAVKQELLGRLYGEEGIAAMRRIKEALDPAYVLAPGVLFPEPGRT
jgi:D-lactate dehydrogenase (cytochrome)